MDNWRCNVLPLLGGGAWGGSHWARVCLLWRVMRLTAILSLRAGASLFFVCFLFHLRCEGGWLGVCGVHVRAFNMPCKDV